MNPNAALIRGLQHADKQEWAAAEKAFLEHLNQDPQNVQAWFCLGSVSYSQNKFPPAEAAFRRAVKLAPDFAEAHNNLGNSILQQDRLEEAIGHLAEAVRLVPDFKEAIRNFGGALSLVGRYPEAVVQFRKAIELDPQDPEAHSFLGLALLVQGDFENGWREYGWRLKTPAMSEQKTLQPRWDGSSLDGKTILLLAEQGLGDTIHFIRYAKRLKERYSCRVIAAVQPQLIPLLKAIPEIDELRSSADAPPPFDYCSTLLDLPSAFQDNAETFPQTIPYLTADPVRVEKWGEFFKPYRGFRIGLSWQGSKAMARDSIRSAPLEAMLHFSKLSGIHLFSLQKGDGTEQIEQLGGRMNVIPLGHLLDKTDGAFLDTAAVLKHLDLVVSVDTAVAHVAGALGVPTWLALHVAPDWRWMLQREDSTWYPQTRLFRQQRLGDWSSVFERMAVELTRQHPQKIGVKSPSDYRIASTGMNRLVAGRHGLMLYNRNDAYIGKSLEDYGEFSDDEIHMFKQALRPGFTVIEAGANIGSHTVELSRIVGNEGRVYAFEPQRILFQTLCANVALNSRSNVICRQEAVGEEPGTILIPALDYRSKNNFGGLALGTYQNGEPVPVVRIDDLELARCNFIKADVEGMEISVLKGARRTIEKFRPVLYVENDRREHSAALIELLLSLEYDLYWDLPPMYRPRNFFANPENVFGGIRSVNMLGVHRSTSSNIDGLRKVTGPTDWWQTPAKT